MAAEKNIRLYYFSNWAEHVQDAIEFLHTPVDIGRFVSNTSDPELMKMGRLDCDWDAESLRALASIPSFELRFLPARIFGRQGLLDLYQMTFPATEDSWIVFSGMRPQDLSGAIGKFLRRYVSQGCRILYWSYDQASYRIPVYAADIAPFLSILVHDETPLHTDVEKALAPGCVRLHRSWVANVVPFSYPFEPNPERKIVFMGSQMGVTEQRRRAIETLRDHFKDAFVAFTDHSVPIRDRARFGRYKVHFCPEGRHFTGYPMRLTHTDRPFWSGCAGQVPVVEDSQWGGRLENLAADNLIFRYPYGDLKAMIASCEAALEAPPELRTRMYNHFNAHETIATTVEGMLVRYYRSQTGT